MVRRLPWILGCTILAFLLFLTVLPALAQESAAGNPNDGKLEGVIFDAYGDPIPGCRVVARETRGSNVFVSAPSDAQGKYTVALPRGVEYRVIALVAPTGGRVAMANVAPVEIVADVISQDLNLPLPVAPRPRKAVKQLGGVDRFFLSFVEDPALAGRQHWELQLDADDFDVLQRYGAHGIAAFQFRGLPRIEFGARGGFYQIDADATPDTESGATDLELWAKIHMMRSARNRFDLAFGVLATLPTGDEKLGLGYDAVQSKAFVAMSYTLRSAVLIWNVGLRSSEDGILSGVPLEGRVAASAGAGFLIPFGSNLSMVVEANYEDRKFEQTQRDGQLLFGINWRTSTHSMLRLAAAGDLEDASPDLKLLGSVAWTF